MLQKESVFLRKEKFQKGSEVIGLEIVLFFAMEKYYRSAFQPFYFYNLPEIQIIFGNSDDFPSSKFLY